MSSKKNLYQLVRNFFQQKPDPAFVKRLEKTLLTKAPQYLNKKEPFWKFSSLLKMHKFSLVALSIFIIVITSTSISLFSNQKNKPSNEEIINRAYAALLQEQDPNGIFYQKILIEELREGNPSKYIQETWSDPEGNFLYLRKNPENGFIEQARMDRKINGQHRHYNYPDFPQFLSRLRSNDPNLFNNMSDQFYSRLSENFYGLLRKSLQDDELENLILKLEAEAGLVKGNLKNESDVFSFDVMNGTNEKQKPFLSLLSENQILFTILIDKKTGDVKAVDTQTQKALTQIYEQKLKQQLLQGLKENPDMATKLINDAAPLGDQYHCFEKFNNPNSSFNMILEIPEQNHTLAKTYGSGASQEENSNNADNLMNSFSKSLDDIIYEKTAPEKVKNILDTLKNKKLVQYDTVQENGMTYYVISYQEKARTYHYFFDAQTYFLKKAQTILTKTESTSQKNAESYISTTTYLETQHFSPSESNAIFNPDKYDLYLASDAQSMWDPDKNMENGCYSPGNKKLSKEEEKSLLNAVPAAIIQQYENSKNEIRKLQLPQPPEIQKAPVTAMNIAIEKLEVHSKPQLSSKVIDVLYKDNIVGVEIPPTGLANSEWCRATYAQENGNLSQAQYKEAYVECKYLSINQKEVIQSVTDGFREALPLATFSATSVGDPMFWTSEDDLHILLPYVSRSNVTLTIDDAVNFKASFQKALDAMDKVLFAQSFTVNEKNSSQNLTDDKFYHEDEYSHHYQRSYENKINGVICTLNMFNSDILKAIPSSMRSVDISFSCSDQFKTFYQKQAPILKSNLQFFMGRLAKPNSYIQIQYVKGDYYYVSVGNYNEPGGDLALIKKNGESYVLIYEGQESPKCELVKKYQVPVALYGSCYNNSGTKLQNMGTPFWENRTVLHE